MGLRFLKQAAQKQIKKKITFRVSEKHGSVLRRKFIVITVQVNYGDVKQRVHQCSQVAQGYVGLELRNSQDHFSFFFRSVLSAVHYKTTLTIKNTTHRFSFLLHFYLIIIDVGHESFGHDDGTRDLCCSAHVKCLYSSLSSATKFVKGR